MSPSETGMSDTLDGGAKAGLWVITTIALISAISVAGLLIYIICVKIIGNRRHWEKEPLTSPGPYFLVNLLICDLLMAQGSIMDAKWARDGKVQPGPYCTSQAVIKQLGNVGVAWTTTIIALWSAIQYKQGTSDRPHIIGIATVSLIWISLGLLVGIPLQRPENYYGPAGNWCWISKSHPTEQIVTEYLWFWICAGLTFLIYTGIFLKHSGHLKVLFGKRGVWLEFYGAGNDGWGFGVRSVQRTPGLEPRQTTSVQGSDIVPLDRMGHHWQPSYPTNAGKPESLAEQSEAAKNRFIEARRLFWYPICYTLVILPQSLIRLIGFKDVGLANSTEATTLGASILALSGLINVILFLAGCRHFGLPSSDRLSESREDPEV